MQTKQFMIATILALSMGLSAAAAPASGAEKAAPADSSVVAYGTTPQSQWIADAPMRIAVLTYVSSGAQGANSYGVARRARVAGNVVSLVNGKARESQRPTLNRQRSMLNP